MVRVSEYRNFCLSLPEVVELPHFEKTSFRVKKKIFSTLDEKKQMVMINLSPVDQSVFCEAQPGIIYPVPGGWGKKGATYVDIKNVKPSILKDAIKTAYKFTAPGKNKNA